MLADLHVSLSSLRAFLVEHPTSAGAILLAAAFVESLVLVGALAPATLMLVAAGGAMAAGSLSPMLALWAMAGAAAGYWLSFELGRGARQRGMTLRGKLGERVRSLNEGMFQRYGPAAVVVGRFLGPVSAVAPFAAGWSCMSRRAFLIADAIASVLWPIAMVAVGYVGISLILRVLHLG
jgi:membrane protein DedA with SNARE-associated domain